MNTANLQLEGPYVAVASMINAIRDKGLLTEQEIETSRCVIALLNYPRRMSMGFAFRYDCYG